MSLRGAAACLLLMAAAPVAAQQPRGVAPAAQVDAVFAEWDRPDSPGCVCTVMQAGDIVVNKGYGSADLDHAVPLGPESVFHVASLAKQFTAAVIFRLVLEGAISLEDDVRRYVPELPVLGPPIRIRHLLHHTSGLRDYHELLGLTGWTASDPITNDDVLALLSRQRALNFPPGAEHVYSNSGYVLLAEVAERASGQSLRALADASFFGPLGMTQTHFEDDHREVVRHRVMSYEARTKGAGQIRVPKNADTYGDMGLLTTGGDLARWSARLDGDGGGEDALGRLLLTPGVLASGETLAYAGGLIHGINRGHPTIGHTGSQQGFRSAMVRFPAQRLTAVVLCNLASIDAGALALQVSDLFLPEEEQPEEPIRAGAEAELVSVSIDSVLLDAYAGAYASVAQPGTQLTFTRTGSEFFGKPENGAAIRLLSVSDSTFVPEGIDALVTFRRNANDAVTGLTLREGARESTYTRFETLLAVDLDAYVGHYASQELGTEYDILIENATLLVRQQGSPGHSAWRPRGRDVFTSDAGRIVFDRDETGRVTALRYTGTSGRIRDLVVERVGP